MATDTVPPTDEAAPEATTSRGDGYVEPRVDVPALTDLLDGTYAEVRRTVRSQLVEHAQVLVDAEEMTRTEFRDRVRDVVLDMAATGQTAMGFPTEHGGGGDIGASLAAFETLRAVSEEGAYGNLVLPKLVRAHRLDRRDAGFATELAYGALRWQGTWDAVLARCVDRPLGELDGAVLDALLGAERLYRTAPGRARWEAAARRNLAAERAALSA